MLYGRDAERARLAAMLQAARERRAAGVLIRGGAGVGKSALLEDTAVAARDARVLRTVGLRSETALAFAGLHRLLRPLGRKNALRIEINGTAGSVAFDFEENNVLSFFDGTKPTEEQGFQRILVTEPEHPYVSAWWPAGHGLGYEHGFTHQVVDLVNAIAENRQPVPSFADGLQVQQVLAAVENSAEHASTWTAI